MIRIMITDEQGTLLGSTTLDATDLSTNGKLEPCYLGGRVLEELPTDKEALRKLLSANPSKGFVSPPADDDKDHDLGADEGYEGNRI